MGTINLHMDFVEHRGICTSCSERFQLCFKMVKGRLHGRFDLRFYIAHHSLSSY